MFLTRRLGVIVAAAALPSLAVAQEATPSGQIGFAAPSAAEIGPDTEAAAAAACNNSSFSTYGKPIKRYKLGMLYALTEYNTTTCASIDKGSWTGTTQQKCTPPEGGKTVDCGKVTTGTLTGYHLSGGACPTHTYNFAAICYTWNEHIDWKITDQINSSWVSKDFDWPEQFPVTVPIIYPTSETTKAKGWDASGLGQWEQTDKNASDPSFDWSGNTVQETNPGTGKQSDDTCYCNGSAIDAFWQITGGTWLLDKKGIWTYSNGSVSYDHVGWCTAHGPDFCSDATAPIPVVYYRSKRRAPCGTTFPQQMQFQATTVGGPWKNYEAVNTLGGSFNDKEVTSLRAGHSEARAFDKVATKARLACAKITWPTPLVANGASAVVSDPRPVAAAIEKIEQLSGKPITYEDPPFLNQYYMTSMVDDTSGDPSLLVPKGATLLVKLPADASAAQANLAVQSMVANYNASQDVASFAVSQGALTEVTPQQVVDLEGRRAPVTPVLDTKISLEAKPRSAMQLLGAIVSAVSTATGVPVGIGTVPTNALVDQQIAIGANDEPAREVLQKLILASRLTLSWRLLYDPGLKTYYLNIPIIQPVSG